MYILKNINFYKNISYIFILMFILQINPLKADFLQQKIADISNKIIDNKVQLKLIDSYLENLNQIYNKKISSLHKKYKEFATSITILYKIKTNPKEILLIEKISKEQTLNTYVVINYWLKSANKIIYKTYLELNSLKDITKDLNTAKQKLISLNQQLLNNQKSLNKLITKAEIQQNNILEINKVRTILKYNSIINTQNIELFSKIDKPLLTKLDQEQDNLFIKNNKGKMCWPSNGYIYNNYQSSKYYSLTYYGISLLTQPQTHIVSPANGEIIFCDILENYNHVIMIKHSPSYISIISGNFVPLAKLAKKVKANEPVGKVDKHSTLIYYELNKQTSPINPIEWLINKK